MIMAWISSNSSADDAGDSVSPALSFTVSMAISLNGAGRCRPAVLRHPSGRLRYLVQEFVECFTDTLEPLRLDHCEIGTGNVPGFSGDLELRDPILNAGRR